MGWRKASVPKKNTPMLMRATVLADENEIPDNHVLTVRDRVLSTDLQRIVQNNVKTDTVTLDLDGEWEGCTVYVTFNDEDSKSGPWSLEWEGQPLTIPSAIGAVVGPVAVSVVGYGSDGELRLVTEAAPALLNVVKSGYVEIVDDNEENKDILSQMVAAGQAAEDAAEAANTAATSATSAASSANSAASSANTAASSANSAATKANSAAVDAQNAYETLQPYMATIDSCANILHREVGPDAVVTADDSFPCKPVEMVVYGNTVQNLWVNPSGTKNGVTFTPNSDGSISIGGSPTGSNKRVDSEDIYVLKPNTQYTISIDRTLGSGSYVMLVGHDADGNQVPNTTAVVTLTGNETFETFTVPSGAVSCTCSMQVNSNGTASGTYRVMLNEGSTAEPWCPPGLNSVGDGGSVKVVTAGKNICDTSGMSTTQTLNGVTFTNNGDGSFSASGTATSATSYTLASNADLSKYLVPGMTVYVNTKNAQYNGDTANMSLKFSPGVNQPSKYIYNGSGVVPEYASVKFEFWVGSGTTVDLENVYPYVLVGSEDAGYVPFDLRSCVTTIPLKDSSENYHTLNALPDGTRDELHVDGGGNVVLEKRVYRAHVEADGFTAKSTEYCESSFGTGCDYADGVMFNPGNQRNDFAPVANADIPFNSPRAAVYTLNGTTYFRAGDGTAQANMAAQLESIKSKVGAKGVDVMWKLAKPQTIDLGTITPPTMAAPNVTAYVADDTPAEMGLDYVRDINIVHSRLEERVAALELASATS